MQNSMSAYYRLGKLFNPVVTDFSFWREKLPIIPGNVNFFQTNSGHLRASDGGQFRKIGHSDFSSQNIG